MIFSMKNKRVLTQAEVVRLLKSEFRRSKLPHNKFAESLGVSKQYLTNVLSGRYRPGKKIGFEKIKDSIRFVRIGDKR